MKIIAKFFLVTALTITTAQAGIFQQCYNIGDDVNIVFTTCVRTNFYKISQRTNLDLSTCVNPGNDVNFAFLYCVNNNFKKTASSLNIKLAQCYNIGTDVNVLFPVCVRNNFEKISQVLK